MARIEEHMQDCYELLGSPYKEVHEFLDQYAERFPVYLFTEYHRSFLHNKYGLEIIKAEWGPKAELAARIHLVRDYVETPIRKWDQMNSNLGKALFYFHDMNNLDPNVDPRIVSAWQGRSLVLISEEEKNADHS